MLVGLLTLLTGSVSERQEYPGFQSAAPVLSNGKQGLKLKQRLAGLAL